MQARRTGDSCGTSTLQTCGVFLLVYYFSSNGFSCKAANVYEHFLESDLSSPSKSDDRTLHYGTCD